MKRNIAILVSLFKFSDRLNKSKRRNRKEIESLNVDLKELFMKEEPFLQANRRASSLRAVTIEYILESSAQGCWLVAA